LLNVFLSQSLSFLIARQTLNKIGATIMNDVRVEARVLLVKQLHLGSWSLDDDSESPFDCFFVYEVSLTAAPFRSATNRLQDVQRAAQNLDGRLQQGDIQADIFYIYHIQVAEIIVIYDHFVLIDCFDGTAVPIIVVPLVKYDQVSFR